MIDIATVEEYMRAANPIPTLDALDADELAFAVAAVDTRRAAAMQAPTQQPTDTATPTAAPPPRRRSVWAFAAAFALVLIVIGAAALILGGDDTAPVVDEPASPTTVVEVPAEPISVESLTWSRVPHDEAAFRPPSDVFITSATAGAPGFVAVGMTTAREGWPTDAAVWTSVDGITWSLIPNDEPPLGGPGLQSMDDGDVTAGGPGLVAVGVVMGEPGLFGLHAAVWTSVDGTVWSRVPHDPDVFGPPGSFISSLRSVIAGGPGLVAVGEYEGRAAVWTSPDGTAWTRVPHDPAVFGRGASEMSEVISGGPGLVAIGVLNGDAAVWTSEDGLVWTPTTEGLTWTSTVVDGGRIWDVTTGGPGLVAVGAYELDPTCANDAPLDCYAAVWTSADGITWEPVPHDDAVFGGGPDKQGMHAVTTVGSDLVAVGTSVWVSHDGITWTRTYQDPAITHEHSGMNAVTLVGGVLVATGEAADDRAIWVATPQD